MVLVVVPVLELVRVLPVLEVKAVMVLLWRTTSWFLSQLILRRLDFKCTPSNLLAPARPNRLPLQPSFTVSAATALPPRQR